MAKLAPYAIQQFFDNNGDPLSGGLLYTYDTGTTTNKATYTDSSEDTANANPVVLDANGRANVWLESGAYTFVLKTSAGVTIETVNDITGEAANTFGSTVVSVSTNTAITTTYSNNLILATGTITLSLLAAADAEEGFVFSVRNTGAGVITLDPDASELINGAATVDIPVGNSVTVICTGTAWNTLGVSGGEDFTVSGNITSTGTLNATTAAITGGTITGITDLAIADGGTGASTASAARANLGVPIIQNYLTGLTLSNDTDTDHDINVTAGQATDSTNASYLTLAAEMTKQIDATWAAGDDAGGLFSGTVANSTTYHVFLIEKDSDGTIDVGFDTSVTAANIPSGYTKYRRIGSVITNGSANIRPFKQYGDRFIHDVIVNSTTTVPTTTAASITLSIPQGITVDAIISNYIAHGGSSSVVYTIINDLAQTNTLPTSTLFTQALGGTASGDNNSSTVTLTVRTSTSGQVRQRSSGTVGTWVINTLGWVDTRGK